MTKEEAKGNLIHAIRWNDMPKKEALKMALNHWSEEPKTGHWIDDKCSICGKGIEDLIDSREWYRNEEPNFCPFCGLRLINSQESEDLGDYPDTIHNQFDNMTGSMNL